MEVDISLRLARRLFDRPLIQNSFRGAFVEELIAPLLDHCGWRHCGDDWSSWDFQHESGARLELKQSAFVQSWLDEGGAADRNPTFNIQEKKVTGKAVRSTSMMRPRDCPRHTSLLGTASKIGASPTIGR